MIEKGGGRMQIFAADQIPDRSSNVVAFPFHRQFFTAKVFAKLLHNDPYGRISIMQFFNYVMRKGRFVLACEKSYGVWTVI